MARLENLLAAQALALTDHIDAADAGVVPTASDRAALVTLLAHPGHPVSWLSRILGLTSSGLTRLVDRMESAGWVERSTGGDARSRRLRLTADGTERAHEVLAAREQAMAQVTDRLSPADRTDLERILGTLVAGLADDRPGALKVCRLCDRAACATPGSECPLEHTRGTTMGAGA
ncbi:MarR family winged helix-turn-helix transcriptional regulator [Williamsia sterculiae]|uniref:DNA-binding transcriptional regulator, MarR family n=1 Tax=Williamsia sterculiae TaxID=1344003 RepID=A0A1N7CL18_9NOCA|nr:MarR family winged helix-turn-helix transcriptional regulator [Williamsia sterculiae]SIR64114.1 DNA-binding transcriptional regulator, MarR family [Williamsia sterculiae]